MRIPLSECQHGHLYRLESRNLSFGVFNKSTQGFIGIRTKFGEKYLFTEFHYEADMGTAYPDKDFGPIPDHIEISEDLGTVDQNTSEPVYYDHAPDEDGNGSQFLVDPHNALIPEKSGGYKTYKVKGWCWKSTGNPDERIRPVRVQNTELFDYLEKFNAKYESDVSSAPD